MMSTSQADQAKFILPNLLPKERDDEHQSVPRYFYRSLTSVLLFLKFRLLEMEVKRGTIEQLRAATMPI